GRPPGVTVGALSRVRFSAPSARDRGLALGGGRLGAERCGVRGPGGNGALQRIIPTEAKLRRDV
ncbi:hypothetical protein ACFL59_13995, partial [Planctomycetota bacterium]